jgi:hypothetical protein
VIVFNLGAILPVSVAELKCDRRISIYEQILMSVINDPAVEIARVLAD